jgi:hypothetical protein
MKLVWQKKKKNLLKHELIIFVFNDIWDINRFWHDLFCDRSFPIYLQINNHYRERNN